MWAFLRNWWHKKRLSAEETAAIRSLESQIKHCREQLGLGSKMRQQTPEEREANPTTFGYARFPLTPIEREGINYRIEVLEWRVRRIRDRVPWYVDNEPPKPPRYEEISRDSPERYK